MDHTLAHARIEHIVGHAAPPVGHGVEVGAAVQENQIEIGGVAQLDTAQFAVADHREAGIHIAQVARS